MKLIDGHDVIEHAEVNGESREFIRKLMDYIEDADAVEPKTGDLIKREDAIKAIEDLPNAYNGWSDTYDKAYIIGTLEEAPSAEPKQGEWERIPYSMADYGRRCSLCHFKVGSPTNFCPNCGARMKGADDE